MDRDAKFAVVSFTARPDKELADCNLFKNNYTDVATKQGLQLFSWDDAKNESNQRKHGVSFAAAQWVFDDPLHVSRHDRIENGEQRWQTIGMAGGVALLLVAHTWVEEAPGGTEHIRIISARRATRLERKIYEQGT